MGFTELDQEAFEVRPLRARTGCLDLALSSRGEDIAEKGSEADRDMLEVSVLRCDCFECLGDPPDAQRVTSERCISELRRFGEVDWAGCRFSCG